MPPPANKNCLLIHLMHCTQLANLASSRVGSYLADLLVAAEASGVQPGLREGEVCV